MYEKLADIITERGWTIGSYENTTGEVCIMGAVAVRVIPGGIGELSLMACDENGFMEIPEVQMVIQALLDTLPDVSSEPERGYDSPIHPITWANDHLTKADVLEWATRADALLTERELVTI